MASLRRFWAVVARRNSSFTPHGLHRHAAWHDAGQPVGRQPGARKFGDVDRHADAAEAVGHSGDSGGDHFGIGPTPGMV
ncbi:hypothetical protein [Octadecabacter antarcticus]|uniref:hypothetical protein n=1 Tax=Octadecabacter antarcticus TaxID=1217908 RepID=UPI00118186F6|nr:hypothetical protein [Octadecabacter antarcticus]